METFTKEELNALGVMVSNAPISGKDAAFVATLLEKIKRLLEQPEEVQVS
jgi:hypothetical protein